MWTPAVHVLLSVILIVGAIGLSQGTYQRSEEGEGNPAQQNAIVGGFWKKHVEWKPRWVQEWRQAKVWKAVWKKVWGPVEIKEWLPVPKPPPQDWDTPHRPEADWDRPR